VDVRVVERLRDEVDQAALAGGADVEQDGPVGGDRGAGTLYVGPPCAPFVLALTVGPCGRGQRVAGVVAEQLQVAADERVERSVGQFVKAVVEVEQRGGVVGEPIAAAVASAGDSGDERVGQEPRPGGVEPVDALADPGRTSSLSGRSVSICQRVPIASNANDVVPSVIWRPGL
jgi:hypothetical protein